ncbi:MULTISPECIES: AzlC family ABC transporter permease [Alphaproteobacteria]|uniref:Branched-chain amino acid ABC transporter permease n=2 Tax=Alphaproteobacteria TaxID=28211 RepID=A0A512HMY4_9HYPH|nr:MULTISPECIES: AzlC family ABC transporter permease [Alphaproteobacteria]GEO86815.1 branched-chain amino acid ABC transporter permease [Ciceribacter naphthalenivorans]GLR23395.1 branched-chain amino acid ABC transporter permease [Ciceribacter naphthalenivorans]GLT06251.1 branched-chain amino acid ABC transporter permease [Sphingomonas psychrolutea]
MRSDFTEGLRGSVPILVSTVPFAALFGAIAVNNGQTVAEATLMSAVIFAGASQLVGIELFGHSMPVWVIVLSIVAVNFRHILYSAAITPFVAHFSPAQKAASFFLLTDPQFAQTLTRGETGRRVSFAWYMGFAATIYIGWVSVTAIGAGFGKLIGDPKALGLDVLLPIYFMGLVFGFRKRPNFLGVVFVSALVSILAQRFVGSPWHVSIGALAGVLLAALLPPKPAPTIGIEPEGEA